MRRPGAVRGPWGAALPPGQRIQALDLICAGCRRRLIRFGQYTDRSIGEPFVEGWGRQRTEHGRSLWWVDGPDGPESVAVMRCGCGRRVERRKAWILAQLDAVPVGPKGRGVSRMTL